jgi:hypothetical protein
VIEVGKFEGLARTIRLSSYKESVFALMAFDYSYALASYVDESFDMKQKGLFAVGGLIGQGPALFELDRKWEKLCKRSDIDIEYFKASECTRGAGQFAKFVAVERHPTPSEQERLDEISCEFIGLITKEFVVGHGITVVQDDFFEVIKDPIAKSILGDTPYRLAYDLAMIQCAWVMKNLEKNIAFGTQPWNKVPRPHVSFVCDEHEKHSPQANDAYLHLKNTNQNAAQYMASYTYADEKQFPVLQAADAIVYEVRRSTRLEMGIGTGEWRKQFKLLDSSHRMALMQRADKTNLLNTVSLHKPGEPFNLDEIMETVFHADIKFKGFVK